jgi:hypothetical protein
MKCHGRMKNDEVRHFLPSRHRPGDDVALTIHNYDHNCVHFYDLNYAILAS